MYVYRTYMGKRSRLFISTFVAFLLSRWWIIEVDGTSTLVVQHYCLLFRVFVLCGLKVVLYISQHLMLPQHLSFPVSLFFSLYFLNFRNVSWFSLFLIFFLVITCNFAADFFRGVKMRLEWGFRLSRLTGFYLL